MNFILWIVFGGLAGWLASLFTGNDLGMGIFLNIVVGIIGAVLGGWIADKMGIGGKPGADRPTNFASFGIAVLGAMLLLFLVNLFF